MSIGWKFPEMEGGSYDGFNESGIEIFAGARFRSLAREVLQNSLDARMGDGRVTVEFEVVSIPSDDFPGRDELSQIVWDCGHEDAADRKAKAFLKHAGQILSARNIQCLRIADYGTTGLRGGPNDRDGQWFAITKARGVNVKQNATAGGSYGIGKNAPFAVSDLHTVFYSTRYADGGKTVQRAQGKSILMSRVLDEESGKLTSGTGFYGIVDKCHPLESDDIPSFLRLKNEGTQILVAGFSGEKDWQNRIVSAVVANFFYAIDQGALEVLIQGESEDLRIVDAETLPTELENEALAKFEGVKNARVYYEIVKEKTNERDMELRQGLGFSRLWTKVEEGLPRQVALLRKTGMLITDEQKGMKKWPGFSDFAAVCVCKSDEGNELLRRMENPQHDAFESDRLGEEGRKKGEKALKELSTRIRKAVAEFAQADTAGPIDLDELREYLPDRDPDESLSGDGEESDLEGAPRYQPKPIKRKPEPLPIEDGGDNEEGGDGEDGEEDGDGQGKHTEDGTGGDTGRGGGGKRGSAAKIDKVRVLHTPDNERKKTVMFTPLESGQAKISLQIAGDSYAESLAVAEVHSGGELTDKGSAIAVDMKKGERMTLEVTLGEAVGEAILIAANKQKEDDDEVRGE